MWSRLWYIDDTIISRGKSQGWGLEGGSDLEIRAMFSASTHSSNGRRLSSVFTEAQHLATMLVW